MDGRPPTISKTYHKRIYPFMGHTAAMPLTRTENLFHWTDHLVLWTPKYFPSTLTFTLYSPTSTCNCALQYLYHSFHSTLFSPKILCLCYHLPLCSSRPRGLNWDALLQCHAHTLARFTINKFSLHLLSSSSLPCLLPLKQHVHRSKTSLSQNTSFHPLGNKSKQTLHFVSPPYKKDTALGSEYLINWNT